MDQTKIGKFIAESRKAQGYTQMQLAEKLGITDRAVSKWERGLAMPDSSLMVELCDLLKISVNDLLCGEKVTMDNYNKKLEENLIEMAKQKEEGDKRLLHIEIVMGICALVPLIAAVLIAKLVPMAEWVATVIVLSGLLPLLIATPFALMIEQKAGYYECERCGHKHVPRYVSVFGAMHIGRTRYMRCPKCNKRSWQKKVISKD